MNRWILGMIAAALAALAVGCGEGDDSTTPITKAEFTEQASAICAEGERNIKAASAKYDEMVETTPYGSTDAGFKRDTAKEVLYGSILPAVQEELERLEVLGAPKGDEAEISKMVKTLSLAIKPYESVGEGLPSPKEYVRFQNEAKAYGLDCSA